MHHSVCVAVCSCLEDLVSKALNFLRWQRPSYLPHIFLEIEVAVLENQVQLVLGIYDFL